MNKKRNFAKMALLSALLCGLASPTFVGCKDYDDDIKDLQEQIDGNKSAATTELSKAISEQITALESKLNTAIADKADKSVISGIQADINTLKGLESRINKLESDASNYLKAGALDGYLKEGALEGLLREDALEQYLKSNDYLTRADVEEIPTADIIKTWLATELSELQDLVDLFNEDTQNDLAKLPGLIDDVKAMKEDLEKLLEENGRLAKLEAKVAAFQSTISSIGAASVTSSLNFMMSNPLAKEITWGYGTIEKTLGKGMILHSGSLEFPVIINPSDVKFDKYDYALVNASGKDMPFTLGVERNWTLNDGMNPFAARSAKKDINTDLYTVKATYVEDLANPFKEGVLALKATSKDGSVSVISKYEFTAEKSAPKVLSAVAQTRLTKMYLGNEVNVNDSVTFTLDGTKSDFKATAASLYNGIGYIMINEDDAFTKKCLENGNIDQELLYKGILKVSEKAENVPFELDDATLMFKYFAMDWNGNLKSTNFSVKFFTQMYSKDVKIDDQAITLTKDAGNALEKDLAFEEILGGVMTKKQLELWKNHATKLVGTITDADGEKVTGAEVVFDKINGKTSFNVSVAGSVKSGDYTMTIKFTDDRTGDKDLFEITGKLTIGVPVVTLNLTEGHWTEDLFEIPGVYTNGVTAYKLKANLKDAFIVDAPDEISPKLEFALVREDLGNYVTINGDEITWNSNPADENLIDQELEFTVNVKHGIIVLSEQTYKLKFVNPLSSEVTQNNVKHGLANDKNKAGTSTYDLKKLLSFEDKQEDANELFASTIITGPTGDFTTLAQRVYGLNKANIKFEIEGTNNTNLALTENGIATWTNVTGGGFSGVDVKVKVTITHKYGTSTGEISLRIEEK